MEKPVSADVVIVSTGVKPRVVYLAGVWYHSR